MRDTTFRTKEKFSFVHETPIGAKGRPKPTGLCRSNSFSTKIKNTLFLRNKVFFIWLGMRDSNPRMLGPKPSALPLGQSLTFISAHIVFYQIMA